MDEPNIDMSSEAISLRLKKVSQLRELCMKLKLAGEKEIQENANNGK